MYGKNSEFNGNGRVKLLLAGEPLTGSAPLSTLARSLDREGVLCSAACNGMATLQWIDQVMKTDVVVLNCYETTTWVQRQMALAVAMGKPLVRRWAGTDVWECLKVQSERNRALNLNRITTLNITPAPHLVEELASIGINAQLIPPILDIKPEEIPIDRMAKPKALLVYLPHNRYEFYNKDLIERAILNNSDIKFIIVADEKHSLEKYQNVESLGWVRDMKVVWEKVGGIVRLTKHDGLPRMVLECLTRGKFAIYSWPLPGCWEAKNEEELQRQLDRFKKTKEINQNGLTYAKENIIVGGSEKIACLFSNIGKIKRLDLQFKAISLLPSLVFCSTAKHFIPFRQTSKA